MEIQNLIEKILYNVEKVIIGKREVTKNILKGMMAGGHILIEDVPGVGKTTLVKALAKTLDLTYSRIQFTPDLLPSDITGISIYNQKEMKFEFKKGPVFSNIVLADEINRTSPKTQSALLEVMEEAQISEGVNTYILDKPFFVLATENPIEYEGTYVLPEAQLDRFIMKISIGYPDRYSEEKILEIYSKEQPMEELSAVASGEDIKVMQQAVRDTMVHKEINSYIVNIAEATRKSEFLNIGISTRAALSLLKIAQAEAVINGRNYVIPEDVKSNAVRVLSHRLTLSSEARANDYLNESIIEEILKHVEVPRI
ncbi:AAA family ATPase [Clostridium oryzae]|uniref:Replication factor C small subunit n=1 Tax=Clostridium oryzae TaxID=1450648 RepID=A0A1V4IHP6_9CLOT|nr:MoxR family ATPase [Clostridium oryzae]OPJ59380.1 replication factor C small subunit [Clostridium oryzae]